MKSKMNNSLRLARKGMVQTLLLAVVALVGGFAATADAEVVSVQRGGVDYYLHPDGLDNVSVLTDAAGNLCERYEYGDHGETALYDSEGQPLAGPVLNPILFGGNNLASVGSSGPGVSYLDGESGLYWTGCGYYDTASGRSTTRGSTDNLGNPYAAFGNNPPCDPAGVLTFETTDQHATLIGSLSGAELDLTAGAATLQPTCTGIFGGSVNSLAWDDDWAFITAPANDYGRDQALSIIGTVMWLLRASSAGFLGDVPQGDMLPKHISGLHSAYADIAGEVEIFDGTYPVAGRSITQANGPWNLTGSPLVQFTPGAGNEGFIYALSPKVGLTGSPLVQFEGDMRGGAMMLGVECWPRGLPIGTTDGYTLGVNGGQAPISGIVNPVTVPILYIGNGGLGEFPWNAGTCVFGDFEEFMGGGGSGILEDPGMGDAVVGTNRGQLWGLRAGWGVCGLGSGLEDVF